MLQHLNVFLVERGPKLNTVFEVWPHQCRVQGDDHFASPAGRTISDTSADAQQRGNRRDFTSDSFLGLNCLTVAAKHCSRASVSLSAIKKQMMPVSVAIEPEWHLRI